MSYQEVLDAPVKLVEFDAVEAGLAELRKDLAGVQYDVKTADGNKAAREARRRCVTIRTDAKKAYEDWNKPMLDKQRLMRDKLKGIETAVKEVEEPIDAQIKAEESRKAEEKAERERVEAERLAAVQSDIDAIKNMAITNIGKPSPVLAAAVEVCNDIIVTLERFGDRAGEAEITKQQALSQLKQMHDAALAHEAEQEKLAAERAELERQRKEQEQRDAEAKAAAAKEEAERQVIIAKQQEELHAQQAELDRQRKEIEDAKTLEAKKEQERLDAIEREKQIKTQAEREEASRRERIQFEENGPGTDAIIEVLALHYRVHESTVIKWLLGLDFNQAEAELAKEFS